MFRDSCPRTTNWRTASGIAWLAIASVTLGACTSSLVVERVGNGAPAPTRNFGLFYALPKTVLLLQLPVVRANTKKGDFDEVTKYFFPFAEPVVETVKYSIGPPTLSAFGVPDAKNVFMVDIRGKRFEDKTLAMAFGEDGVVEKYEAESFNHTSEIITQIIKSAASLGAKALAAPLAAEASPGSSAICQAVANMFQPPFSLVLESECRAMPPALQRGLQIYVGETSGADERAARFMRANKAFLRLKELQGLRDGALRLGSVPQAPSQSYLEVLSNIDEEMNQLQAEFFGTVEKTPYWTALFEVTPTSALTDVESVDLFNYSAAQGICAGPLSGTLALELREPLPPPARAANCPEPVTVRLKVKRPANQFPEVVAAAIQPAPGEERGMYYRLPGKAFVTLESVKTGQAIAAGIAQFSPAVAQFGHVVSLPSTTGGRRTQYATELFSATGAMRSFKLGSESVIDKGMVADVGTAATELVEGAQTRRAARDARDKERKEESDELTQLRRQADILEAQLRIKKAQEALTPPKPDGQQ